MLNKELLKGQLESLPDTFSVDELIERLILIDNIEKGIEDSKNGKTISHKEMGIKIKKWMQV